MKEYIEREAAIHAITDTMENYSTFSTERCACIIERQKLKIFPQPMLHQYDTEDGYIRIGATMCPLRTVQNVEPKRNTGNIEGCRNIIRFARRVVLSWTQRRKTILAQLYKMTLYVCDLEENLSLSEIKRLIEDDALDGISTSCVTHFANEKLALM